LKNKQELPNVYVSIEPGAVHSSGEMALRWTAAGMLEAERQFRRIIGYRDLATLVVAIEHDHDHRRHSNAARTPTKEATIVLSP
jgi:putative transposase